MTPERWNYIKSLAPTERVAWPSSHFGTLDLGKNKAKRARRALFKNDDEATMNAWHDALHNYNVKSAAAIERFKRASR